MTSYGNIIVIGTQTSYASDLDLITQLSITNSTGRAYRRSEFDSACPSRKGMPSEGNWRILETYLGMVPADLNLMGVSRTSGSVGTKLNSTMGWITNTSVKIICNTSSILEDGKIRAFCSV